MVILVSRRIGCCRTNRIHPSKICRFSNPYAISLGPRAPAFLTATAILITTEFKMRLPKISLTWKIIIGLLLGVLLGYLKPEWGTALRPLSILFLNLIKSVIAPLIFSTLVIGIAGTGDIKQVGRMGAKALLYFEIVTTFALFIGLAAVNITRPG